VRCATRARAELEGALHKPADFQAGRRYPLLVVIHGGPTGVSRPQPYGSASFYPIDGWLTKGALVLEPNYRGSAGYGEAFRSLNVRNLGIGDAWDVLGGIDALVGEGLVEQGRGGAKGKYGGENTPVEVGDTGLRASLAGLRELIGDLAGRARGVVRTLGR